MIGTTTQRLGLAAVLVTREIEFPEGTSFPVDAPTEDEICWFEPGHPFCQDPE